MYKDESVTARRNAIAMRTVLSLLLYAEGNSVEGQHKPSSAPIEWTMKALVRSLTVIATVETPIKTPFKLMSNGLLSSIIQVIAKHLCVWQLNNAPNNVRKF